MKISKKQLQEMVRKEAKRQLKEQNRGSIKHEEILDGIGWLSSEAEAFSNTADALEEMAKDVDEMEGPKAVNNWNQDSDVLVENLKHNAKELLNAMKQLGLV